jgi:hypothetical protein
MIFKQLMVYVRSSLEEKCGSSTRETMNSKAYVKYTVNQRLYSVLLSRCDSDDERAYTHTHTHTDTLTLTHTHTHTPTHSLLLLLVLFGWVGLMSMLADFNSLQMKNASSPSN